MSQSDTMVFYAVVANGVEGETAGARVNYPRAIFRDRDEAVSYRDQLSRADRDMLFLVIQWTISRQLPPINAWFSLQEQ